MRAAEPSADPIRVSLVDLSGETNVRYTPLACMCIKAALHAQPDLAGRFEARVHAFLQSHLVAEMIDEIRDFAPHIVAMSCQGWNMRQLEQTFASLKQLLPDTLLVLGGNHVSHRGDQLLARHPTVDLIVNGEGEFTFCDLVRRRLDGEAELETLAGISFRDASGAIVTTPDRAAVRQMALLPSPYRLPDFALAGYDVALLETNRGCPYHCAFCYWGGRVGQKLARGELDRVREDLEAIGKAGIETIFLCDANFGILEQDIEIAHMVVEVRDRYGAPREFNVNWAKNHAHRVGEIIRILQRGGIHTAINVPLQTLSPRALSLADRNETGRAEMIAEARSIIAEGTEVFCELIFGLPGETLDEFKANYDRLLQMFPVLRIHPLWILPNTTYDRNREAFRIRTISPDMQSDYEAIYEHLSMTSDDVRDGLAILLAHSNVNLLGLGRNAMRGYSQLTGASAAATLVEFERFLMQESDGLGSELAELYRYIRRACYFERHLRDTERQLIYRSHEESFELMRRFLLWLAPPEPVLAACLQLARYDSALLPRSELTGEGMVESAIRFDFDPVAAARRLRDDVPVTLAEIEAFAPAELTLAHKAGLGKLKGSNCDLTGSWNGRIVANRRAELAASGA